MDRRSIWDTAAARVQDLMLLKKRQKGLQQQQDIQDYSERVLANELKRHVEENPDDDIHEQLQLSLWHQRLLSMQLCDVDIVKGISIDACEKAKDADRARQAPIASSQGMGDGNDPGRR